MSDPTEMLRLRVVNIRLATDNQLHRESDTRRLDLIAQATKAIYAQQATIILRDQTINALRMQLNERGL